MKESVAIVGGGLSGISAAVNLSQQTKVHLFEASPHLGGRVRSFYDKEFDCYLDNGMHLMIGAYAETFALMEQLNSIQYIKFSPLDIPFHFPVGSDRNFRLKSNTYFPGSMHLLFSLIRAKVFSFKELLGTVKLLRFEYKESMELTCSEMLGQCGQSDRTIDYFWRPLILATLNAEPEQADAENLLAVLKRGFFKGWRESRLAFPDKPFSDLFENPVIEYFARHKINFNTGKAIKKIEKENGYYHLETGKDKYGPFKAVIMALPKIELNRIIDPEEKSFAYSPISSFYFKTSGMGLPTDPIIALLDSPLHWLFYLKDRQVYTVTASSVKLEMDAAEIEMELKRLFPCDWTITYFKRIITKRATPILNVRNKSLRKAISRDERIIIAGDWTDTGLPATIEGAVLSGKKAAAKLMGIMK